MDNRARIAKLEAENREMRRRIELMETGRSACQRFSQMVPATFEMEAILDALAAALLKVGVFRSLTIGLVDDQAGYVKLVRNLLCEMPQGQVTTSSKVISSSNEVMDDRNMESNSVVGRRIWLDKNDDMMALTVQRQTMQAQGFIINMDGDRRIKMAYFIPVIYGERVLAVLATDSEIEEQQGIYDLISALEPLIEQMANTLEYARNYDELEREREHMAATLSNIGEGVISVDANGRIVLLNKVAETYCGWTQEAASGIHLEEIMQLSGNAEGAVPAKAADLDSGAALIDECKMVSRDGVTRLIRHGSVPIRDEAQQIVGSVYVLSDFTQQQRFETETETERARRIESLGLLASSIAHDYNNILAAVLVNVSVLKTQLKGQNIDMGIIHDIEISMGQARHLTQQMMTSVREAN